MADLGGMFGYSFGGDFANSFAKGMQIGLMQRQMEMNEKKIMQDYEMNHLLKEEMGLKVRAQRNALEEANRYRQQWDEWKKPTEITHEIPAGGDEFSGPTDMRTETLIGPSRLQQMFPGQVGQILEMGGPDIMKTIAPALVKEKTTAPPHTTIGGKMYQYVGGKWSPVEGIQPENKAPTVHTFTEGDRTVEKQWNPEKGQWDVVSSGPRYKPPQPAQNYDKNILIAASAAGIDPEKVKSGNLTQEEAIKVADSYSRRFGTQSLIQLLMSGGAGSSGTPSVKYDANGNPVK